MTANRTLPPAQAPRTRAALANQCLQLGSGLAALLTLGAPASALQGQPVTAQDRNTGLSLRELVEGTATGVGGAPLITITGTPGTIYELFGGFGALAGVADVATAPPPGVIGPISAPLSAFPAAFFIPDVGTVGVIPPGGVQNLTLAFPLPAGLAGVFLDMQMFSLSPGAFGVLELSDGQIRQIMPAPPAVAAWTAGAPYPGSAGEEWEWTDIEQGDVDGDGDSDTVGANNPLGLVLWLTTGGAHVAGANPLFDPGNAVSCELADFNDDGFLDVVGAYRTGDFIRVFMNNGIDAAGTWLGFTEFTPTVDPGSFLLALPSADFPWDVEVADVNADGLLDIFFACSETPDMGGQNRLLLGLAVGPIPFFVETTTFGGVPANLDDSRDCEFLDFDLDGDQDIVVANFDGPAGTLFGQGGDYILIGDGVGGFTAPLGAANPITVAGADESIDVAVGDLDGDGSPDLFFSNWAATAPAGVPTTVPPTATPDRVLFSVGAGAATTLVADPAQFPAAAAGLTFTTDAEILDADFDGDLDIVTANGTLGTAAPFPVAAGATATGASVLINPPGVGPFGARAAIAPSAGMNFRDVEHGDWREVASPGGFGRFFEKDLGGALISTPAPLSALITLDHL